MIQKIYMSLIVYIMDKLNILCMAINVLDLSQLSDVYQTKMYAGFSWFRVTAFFCSFYKHTLTAKCNFIAG